MKKLILILFLCAACSNMSDQGFTDKSEAKNEMVNGKKEGKWVEYFDKIGFITYDTNKAVCYSLTIYKTGIPFGIVRKYWESGILQDETPFVNGKENGIQKSYYENGKLLSEVPYTNGNANGVSKLYYENGKVEGEITYTNGRPILKKDYDESGNEIKQ